MPVRPALAGAGRSGLSLCQFRLGWCSATLRARWNLRSDFEELYGVTHPSGSKALNKRLSKEVTETQLTAVLIITVRIVEDGSGQNCTSWTRREHLKQCVVGTVISAGHLVDPAIDDALGLSLILWLRWTLHSQSCVPSCFKMVWVDYEGRRTLHVLIKNICLSWPLKILVTDLFQFRQSLHKGFPGD